MIENCRALAGATTAPTAKVRSLLVVTPDLASYGGTFMDMMRDYRLDFVEFPVRGKEGLVDRAGLAPRGDPRCAPTQPMGLFFRGTVSRLPFSLAAPNGQCIAIELDQTSRAEMRFVVTEAPMGDHGSEVHEALRASDGASLGRVQNFAIRYAEAGVDCREVVRTVPRNPVRFLLDHIAERR